MFIFLLLHYFLKSRKVHPPFFNYSFFRLKPFFSHKIFCKIKSPSASAKGLGIVWLPLLVRFRTFCWGEITEELRKTYKLKDLANVPISVINNV